MRCNVHVAIRPWGEACAPFASPSGKCPQDIFIWEASCLSLSVCCEYGVYVGVDAEGVEVFFLFAKADEGDW